MDTLGGIHDDVLEGFSCFHEVIESAVEHSAVVLVRHEINGLSSRLVNASQGRVDQLAGVRVALGFEAEEGSVHVEFRELLSLGTGS